MDLEFRESLLLSQKTLGEVCLLNQVSILKSLLFPRHISSRVLIELGEARYLRHEKNILMLESSMSLVPLFLSVQLLKIHSLFPVFLDLWVLSESLRFPIPPSHRVLFRCEGREREQQTLFRSQRKSSNNVNRKSV